MNCTLRFSILAGLVVALASPLHARTFTYFNGRQVEAEFVRLVGNQVTLNIAGKPTVVPFGLFSVADQKFIRESAAGAGPSAPAAATNNLIVYGPVPGLAPSEHYAVRVRSAGVNAPWQSPFVFKTACKDVGPNGKGVVEGYWRNLSGWSHSYVNFETSGPVEVEVAKADGKAIRKATVHPERYGRNVQLKGGKAHFTLEKPCLVAVDIDGAMRDQDTTVARYHGPRLHGLSIFANPIFANKPQLGDPEVYAVKPGEAAPTNGVWQTLYFLPGVHELGLGYRLQKNKRYYLPGDALVYGTLQTGNGPGIRLFGCGTISGDHLEHPTAVLRLDWRKGGGYSPISISNSYNTTVEGITIANPAYWSCNLWTASDYDAKRPTIIRWVKVLGWRVNTDAFGQPRNAIVEDCFVRTQDDCIYPCGFGIRRLVIWHDANGSAFLLSFLSRQKGQPLVVEDCDVIFARQGWYDGGCGGRIFNMRAQGGGESGQGVIFRNIRVEDPRPSQQAFLLQMAQQKPHSNDWSKPTSRGPGDLVGVVFQNIQIAAPSIFDVPNILRGGPDCKIRNLTFDNVTIGGKKLTSIKDFTVNEYVENIHFK